MENLQKLEEFLNLATANGGFKTSAQAMQAGLTLQAVVKDMQSLAQEVNRLKQFEPKEDEESSSAKPTPKKK